MDPKHPCKKLGVVVPLYSCYFDTEEAEAVESLGLLASQPIQSMSSRLRFSSDEKLSENKVESDVRKTLSVTQVCAHHCAQRRIEAHTGCTGYHITCDCRVS